jgi:HPt (histidine-containing phosphotransfer) domain-containing protein
MGKMREQSSEAVWNISELLVRVDNDQELVQELLSIFKEDFPQHFCALEEAVAAGNLKNVGALSHTLKGMFANLASVRAAAAAARLEQMARAEEKVSLKEALESLKSEIANLLPVLDAYMAEVRP